jgi:hypothetical protein
MICRPAARIGLLGLIEKTLVGSIRSPWVPPQRLQIPPPTSTPLFDKKSLRPPTSIRAPQIASSTHVQPGRPNIPTNPGWACSALTNLLSSDVARPLDVGDVCSSRSGIPHPASRNPQALGAAGLNPAPPPPAFDPFEYGRRIRGRKRGRRPG